MKKIISSILFLAIIITASAQSFEKGSKVIGLGSGLGIYKTKWEDKSNSNNTDDDDGAGAFVFPLTFEYGVLNWLGAGARLGYSNYIEGNDSSNTNANENARGIDFNGFMNLHFLRTNHVDMFVSGEFGYSNFKYTADVTSGSSTNSAMAKASGTGYSVGLNTRFYFGKKAKFGINLRFAFEGFNYENGEITDNQGSTPYKFGLKGDGKLFGIGLQYKI